VASGVSAALSQERCDIIVPAVECDPQWAHHPVSIYIRSSIKEGPNDIEVAKMGGNRERRSEPTRTIGIDAGPQ